MKLMSKEAVKNLEQAASEQGVTFAQLMENAGKALFYESKEQLSSLEGKRILILCGKGNNGGDGFVAARLLWEKGARVQVILAEGPAKTQLAQNAFSAMPSGVEVMSGEEKRSLSVVQNAQLILDAVYGFGFRGELTGIPATLLEAANQAPGLKIACDLPSGAECDAGRVSPHAFRADVTVTFTAKKPACVSYPSKEYCGQVKIADVGIPWELLQKALSESPLEETGEVALPAAPVQSHKGSRGKLLLVCGSFGMAGACMMAARAALRSGAGLLQLAVDESIYPILAGAVPEAVFTVLRWEESREESEEKLKKAMEGASACLVGCGLGELREMVCPTVFSHCEVPLLADADALNFLSEHPEFFSRCKAPLVLTPHPGELSRLLSESVPSIQANRLETAKLAAARFRAVTVLKGAATITASPEGRCAVNPTGNPGMAKGGSGDVLAGIMASLLAQGLPPFEAAKAAAYFHGKAGDLCKTRLSQRTMLPTDLIEELPRVF